MSKRIGVLTIHGMGEEGEDFDVQLRRGLKRTLSPRVYDDLVIQSIWFHEAIGGPQQAVWERMRSTGLRYRFLRDFALFYLSDVTAYEGRAHVADSVYRKVHRIIKRRIDLLAYELGVGERPVVVFAHSLGCQVISNYIWDAQQSLAAGGAPSGIWPEFGGKPNRFQALATMRYLFTTGCNIPLFVSAYERIEAISRPSPVFEWINYYDRDDVLGWPLKPLSTGFPNAYDAVVTQDVEINVGYTPLSHMGYWTDKSFLRSTSEKLAELHGSL
jgi:pimeloyl-ACP methyl ester carboxylesterase